MPRKKGSSVRGKREKEAVFSETREGTINLIKSLNAKLKEGKALRDEEIRFLKNAPSLLTILEEREKIKEAEIKLPEGKLKDYVEKIWQMEKILKATNYGRGREGVESLLEAAGYYICDFCGFSHVLGKECPFLKMAKELKIDLSDKPSNEELDILT